MYFIYQVFPLDKIEPTNVQCTHLLIHKLCIYLTEPIPIKIQYVRGQQHSVSVATDFFSIPKWETQWKMKSYHSFFWTVAHPENYFFSCIWWEAVSHVFNEIINLISYKLLKKQILGINSKTYQKYKYSKLAIHKHTHTQLHQILNKQSDISDSLQLNSRDNWLEMHLTEFKI